MTPVTALEVRHHVQALAAVCRHVAVEVVTAAERDGPDAQPSPDHTDPLLSEQQPPGEEAHLRSGGWDVEPAVSAPDAASASWLASGGGRSHRRRFQHGPAVGHSTAAELHVAPSAQRAAAEDTAADEVPSGGMNVADPAQMSMVRHHCKPRPDFDCLQNSGISPVTLSVLYTLCRVAIPCSASIRTREGATCFIIFSAL